jgi:hypothetical protein
MVSGGSSFITSSSSGITEYNLHANYSKSAENNLDYKRAGVSPTEFLPIRVYQPITVNNQDAPPLKVILWFHGGGWVVGSVDADDGLLLSIVKHTGYIVVAVDYRLAPEYLFPHAIYDCIVALNWVRQNIAAYGGDANSIFVAGESAGGNLAAALVSRDIATPHRNFAPIAGSALVSVVWCGVVWCGVWCVKAFAFTIAFQSLFIRFAIVFLSLYNRFALRSLCFCFLIAL